MWKNYEQRILFLEGLNWVQQCCISLICLLGSDIKLLMSPSPSRTKIGMGYL